MSAPRPRRRWLTYSLRTLLLLLTVVAIVMGRWANRAHQQRNAVATIEQHSPANRVEYDFELERMKNGSLSGFLAGGSGGGTAGGAGGGGGGGGTVVASGVVIGGESKKEPPSRLPESIRKALGKDYFNDVVSVVFGRSFDRNVPQPTPEQDRAVWKSLTGLWNLNQVTTYIDALDEDLAHLATLRRVTSVDLLKSPQLTDAGLRSLGRMPQLTALTIAGGHYTTAGIAQIAGLKHLNRLGLLSWNNGDQSVDPLARWLGADLAVDITDEQLELIAGLSELEQLNFASTQVTDRGLAHLARLKKLKMLDLGATNVTAEGFTPLAELPELVQFDLYAPNLSDEDVARIRAMLPQCRVYQVAKP